MNRVRFSAMVLGLLLLGGCATPCCNKPATVAVGPCGEAVCPTAPIMHAAQKVQATGYGNIGNFNNGNAGTNLDGPASLDGINFGIVSSAAGFNPNGGLAAEPLIQNAVIFVLTGVAGLTTADISNVSFQYGTALTELNVPGHPGTSVPEPGSLALVAAGLAGVSTLRRRKA